MCLGGGAPAPQYQPAPAAVAPTPTYAPTPAADAPPEISALDAAAKSRTQTRKRLGVFGNTRTSANGDSAYGGSSVATFGGVGR